VDTNVAYAPPPQSLPAVPLESLYNDDAATQHWSYEYHSLKLSGSVAVGGVEHPLFNPFGGYDPPGAVPNEISAVELRPNSTFKSDILMVPDAGNAILFFLQ